MPATERLYFDDPYLLEFEAEIVARMEQEGLPAVVLDRTAFYPESGGQPWDKGTLNGVEVLKVVDLDGAILHTLRSDIPAGPVRGRIDAATRTDHMQQHTGQHILSQAFWELLKGETLSFHMGPDVSTLEIGLKTITDSDCDRVEDRANAVIWQDREVKTYFIPEERIAEVPLRRPPKKQGLLRVVEVDGFDYSACGGTHVRRTGEIGSIKIGGIEKIRGNLRFDFLCGGRALEDYRAKDRAVRKLAAAFSCSAVEIPGQVEKLLGEARAAKKRTRQLGERLAAFESQEIIRSAAGRVIAGVLEGRTPEEARFLALNIAKRGDFAVAYGAAAETQGHIILARSETLKADLRQLIPVVAAVVPVKGGGGPSLVELVTPDKGRLKEAVDAAAGWLKERA
ncbi:MAG TPA: alanyl-tRNA editing protein [Acidobacteriota bacterium]|nr:alanyl-tRNA editing protein [Acidobacteriota bacterium]